MEEWHQVEEAANRKDYVGALRILDGFFNPHLPGHWFSKGMYLFLANRQEEALKCFGEAVNLYPLFSEAWFWRGSTEAGLSKLRAAYSSFERCIESEDAKIAAGKPVRYSWSGVAALKAWNVASRVPALQGFEASKMSGMTYRFCMERGIVTTKDMPIEAIYSHRWDRFVSANSAELLNKLTPNLPASPLRSSADM